MIMDNGRSKLLADPELREALNCIRCGACLNTCPVYQKIGGHAYGWVYPGPIGSVLTPAMNGAGHAKDLPFASTLCGACRDACPVKINIPRMLLKLRQDLKEGDKEERKATFLERFGFGIWSRIVASEGTLSKFRAIAVLAQRPFVKGSRLRRIPLAPFSKWTSNRDFPRLAPKSFHKVWKQKLKQEDEKTH